MHVLLALPIWLVVALVALLPALEASALLGLVVPGETAVLAGGVVAHTGEVPLWLVIVAAVAGAVAGDQVGYAMGRRYGPALLRRLPARTGRNLDRALSLIRRRGIVAVLVGRWAAALRALVPGLAGMSGVSRTWFTVANVVGGAAWATTVATGGYLAGVSYQVLERRLGIGSEALLVVTVALLGGWWLYLRRVHRLGRRDQRPHAKEGHGDGSCSRA